MRLETAPKTGRRENLLNLNCAEDSCDHWDALTGTDDNFDGTSNDRLIIGGRVVERNGFENDKLSNVDKLVTKRFAIKDSVNIAAFVEFFNLFNARNLRVNETRYGRTEFGIPTRQGGDPFSLQLGFRFDF